MPSTYPAPEAEPPDWRTAGLVALVAVGLVLALSWPVALHPRSTVIGPGAGDFPSIAWGLWQITETWPSLPPTRFEHVLFPEGASLLLADLPESWLLAPVTMLLGPIFTYNLLQVAHVGLAAAAATLLARDLGAAPWGAARAGMAFGFGLVLLTGIFNGNPDVTPLFAVPFAGFLSRRATSSWAWAVAAAVGIGLAPWLNPYGGLMAGLCALLLTPFPRSGIAWARLLGAGAGALVIALAWVLLVQGTLDAGDSMVMKNAARPAGAGAAWLDGFVRPLVVADPDPWTTHAWYLGWSVLLLAGGGLVVLLKKAPALALRLVILGIVGVVLSLGSTLFIAGEEVLSGGQPIYLPVIWLKKIEAFAQLQIVYRFAALAALAVGLLAALPVLPRRIEPVIPALIALELLTVGKGHTLLGSASVPRDPACTLLVELPEGPVFNLPLSHHEEWLLGQTCHGRPIAQGINKPVPKRVRRAIDNPGPSSLGRLDEMGYRYVLLHLDGPPGDAPMKPDAAEGLERFEKLGRALDLVVAEQDRVIVIDLERL